MQPVVGSLRRALPQAPWLGCQHLPGHVTSPRRAAAARALVKSRGSGNSLRGDLEELGGPRTLKSRASWRSPIASCSAILRAASLLLFQLLDSLLQGLHHAPEDHVELLVVERHQLPAVQVLGLAHLLAQRGGLHLLGDETDLVLAPLDAVVHPGLHGIEGLLELLLRELPHVRLECLVREVHEAVAEDQLPVVAAANVRFDRQVGEAVGGVEAHELKQGVHLHAAAGERLELHQPVLRVAVQDQRCVSRGRGVARH